MCGKSDLSQWHAFLHLKDKNTNSLVIQWAIPQKNQTECGGGIGETEIGFFGVN